MGFYDKYIRMSCRGMSARLPNTHAHIHTLMDCVPVGILWSVRSEQKWLSAHKSKCSRRNKKQHQRIVKLLLTSEGIWMLFDICNWFSANQWYSRLCWWSKVWTQFFSPRITLSSLKIAISRRKKQLSVHSGAFELSSRKIHEINRYDSLNETY